MVGMVSLGASSESVNLTLFDKDIHSAFLISIPATEPPVMCLYYKVDLQRVAIMATRECRSVAPFPRGRRGKITSQLQGRQGLVKPVGQTGRAGPFSSGQARSSLTRKKGKDI